MDILIEEYTGTYGAEAHGTINGASFIFSMSVDGWEFWVDKTLANDVVVLTGPAKVAWFSETLPCFLEAIEAYLVLLDIDANEKASTLKAAEILGATAIESQSHGYWRGVRWNPQDLLIMFGYDEDD